MTDPTSIPSFPPPRDEHPLRGRVIDALQDAGFVPNIDERGSVAVTVNKQQLFVRCVDGKVPMLRAFGQWRIGESAASDELTRLKAANQVSSQVSIVKTLVNNDLLVVAAEYVVNDHTDLGPLLRNTFEAMLHSVQRWHKLAADKPETGTPGTD